MNRLHDHDGAELLALTEEQIETLIDLECAVQGVPLLPEVTPTPPAAVEAEPDQLVHSVAGYYFRDKETADAVAEFIGKQPRLEDYYLNGRWSGPKGVRPDPEPSLTVSVTKFWTEAHYDKHRNALEEYKGAKEAYDLARKAYERVVEERSAVAAEVHSAIREARHARDTRAQIGSEFQRYLRLAEGDHDVALKFFLDATDYDRELVDDVLGFNAVEEKVDTPAEG